jgi:hypothetical protein
MFSNKMAGMLVALVVLALVLGTGATAVADEPDVGTLRIAGVQYPKQVAPSAQASFGIDVEYAVRTNATIKSSLFEGTPDNLGPALWQSDSVVVRGGGDQVWNTSLTAPSVEGDWSLTAFAYYREGSRWVYFNDSLQGPGFVSFSVKVSKYANLQVDLGIPNASVTVNNSTEKTSASGSFVMKLHLGQQCEISVPTRVELGNQTSLIFSSWQDGSNSTQRTLILTGDTIITASYRTQYLLRVSSVVPAYSYSAWKDAGSNVSLYASSTVPLGWPLGSLGVHYVFEGWSGSARSSANALNFTMDGPKTITANYYVDYTMLVIPAIVAVGVIGGIILSVARRRAAAEPAPVEEEAVSEDQVEQSSEKTVEEEAKTSRFCDSCGEKIEVDWTHCVRCGRELPPPDSGPPEPVQG